MASQATLGDHVGLERRLKWLIGFRLVSSVVFVFSTIFWKPGGDTNPIGFLSVLIVTGSHFVAAMAFYLIGRFRTVRRVTVFALTQIMWDLIFATAIVYLSGGIDSEVKFTYWLSIAFAAIVMFRAGAFSAAALSGMLYGLLLNLQLYGRIRPVFDVMRAEEGLKDGDVIRSIVIQAVGFFFVAFVMSWISGRLRQTEEELVERSHDLEDLEVLMGRIVESLTNGLVTLDPSGRVTFWNRAAEQITGLSSDDVKGKRFIDFFPDAEEALKSDPKNLAGRPWRWEMNYQGQATPQILGFSVSPMRYGTQEDRGRLVIFQDLTRYREMEDQVKRADRLAAIGELAARMAHEIRNPLTAVSGSIEMLQGRLVLPDKDRRLMEIVLKETERLNLLLGDFLLYAKPSASRMEDLALNELIEDTLELFSKSSPAGAITLNRKIEKHIWLLGDPKQITQMLWNLLKNAAEAAGEAGRIEVKLRQETEGGWIALEIEDSGPGIPVELRQQVFQPFFTTKTKGTGLGLAMVRRIAEEHQGSVEVKEGPEGGTLFCVRLPSAAASKLQKESA